VMKESIANLNDSWRMNPEIEDFVSETIPQKNVAYSELHLLLLRLLNARSEISYFEKTRATYRILMASDLITPRKQEVYVLISEPQEKSLCEAIYSRVDDLSNYQKTAIREARTKIVDMVDYSVQRGDLVHVAFYPHSIPDAEIQEASFIDRGIGLTLLERIALPEPSLRLVYTCGPPQERLLAAVFQEERIGRGNRIEIQYPILGPKTIEEKLEDIGRTLDVQILPSHAQIRLLVEESMKDEASAERVRELRAKCNELAWKSLDGIIAKHVKYINEVWPLLLEKHLNKWAVIFPDSFIVTDSEEEAYNIRRKYDVPSVVKKVDEEWEIHDPDEIYPRIGPRL
jgi:hypothetical protein